ncbi:MAG TPA: DUF6600 domain-containing protein [Terriglobales bacterium]|nr:DUF6600 domain-containing protein [Terriglobales bacterium]
MSLLVGVALLLAAPPARADSPGVARISLVNGDVSMLRQGGNAWTSAVLNTPLVQGDEIYVPGDGRAEIEFDYADVARLAAGTDLVISSFNGNQLQVQLKSGTLSCSAIGDHFLNTEIDTPNMSVRPTQGGTLRVDVVDASHTSATVWSGTAQVFTPQGSVVVRAGQQAQIEGSSNPQFQVVDAPQQDAWDQWVNTRENRILDARDYRDRYVNTEIYGGEDLDSYGHWVWVPGYGRCWTPLYTVADWSPYYFGRWVWTPYYGWTWVSYEPWGWAPYHYGRWFWRAGFGWCWWPGGFYGPHWWAPAYVSFFVGGPHWGLSFGFGGYGGIGWIPLAPYEPYYGYSRARYITNITNVTNIYNITNVTNVTNINGMRVRHGVAIDRLANARVRGGIIAVSQQGFASGRVDQIGRVLPVSALRDVRSVRGTAPIAPTRAALDPLPGRRGVAPPARIQDTRVFSHRPVTVRANESARLAAVENSMASARSRAGLTPRLPVMRADGRPAAPAGGIGMAESRNVRPANPAGPRFENMRPQPAAGNAPRSLGQVANEGRGMRPASPTVPRFEIVRPNAGSAPGDARGAATGGTAPANGGWRHFGAPANSDPRMAAPAPAPRATGGNGGGFENHPMGGSGARVSAPRGNADGGGFNGPARDSAPSRGNSRGFENRPAAPRGDAGGRAPAQPAPARPQARPAPSSDHQHLAGARFENHPMGAYGNYSRASSDFGGRGASGGSRGFGIYRGSPSYSAAGQPAYRNSGPRYSEPRYSAPQYSTPRYSGRGYSEPRYSMPSRSYSMPSRSYSMPSRSYSAPSRSYSAPSRSYSAPRSNGGGWHSRR